jgi:hypothetical protein
MKIMLNHFPKLLVLLITVSLWEMAVRPLLFTLEGASAQTAATQNPKDNDELRRLGVEDQADRSPAEVKSIDWAIVGPRDKARLKRVKELYTQNLLQTANDYDSAAIILQHGDVAEDFLLAHEFWVVTIIKGKNDPETRSMVVASEDRFLMNIGRPQRFGTQFRSVDNGPVQLYPVGPGVTDELRRLMGVHTLTEIKAHEAEMNRK